MTRSLIGGLSQIRGEEPLLSFPAGPGTTIVSRFRRPGAPFGLQAISSRGVHGFVYIGGDLALPKALVVDANS